MSGWEQACRAAVPEGWEVTRVEPPEFDADAAIRCMTLCEKNDCGNYGTNWGCAPGWNDHMDVLGERFDSALLLERTIEGDPFDKELAEGFSRELRRSIRMILTAFRSEGTDCMGFAGGGCDYCGVCSYPEPCRFPEQLVPSVSALAVDLGRYLESFGKTIEFRNDRISLYGLVLFKS